MVIFDYKSIWFVYLLKCSDNTLYCGITNNIINRIKKHNSGVGAKYTKGRCPVKFVFAEMLNSKSEALKKEMEIKKKSRKDKINYMKNLNIPKSIIEDNIKKIEADMYYETSPVSKAKMQGMLDCLNFIKDTAIETDI